MIKTTLVSAAILLGSITFVDAQEAVRVTDETTFRKMIVDKKWTHAWGKTWVQAKSDGTLIGDSPNGKIKGNWVWKGKNWCRSVSVGKEKYGEECQQFYMIGDRIYKNVTSRAPKGNYYFLR